MGPIVAGVLICSLRKDGGSTVRAFTGCENEKSSKDELLLNDSICRNTLSSNLGDLLEQIENRCEENLETLLINKRYSSHTKIGCLKKELRNNVNVSWHMYDVSDLWAALKNYLRHLPSCPLGSLYYTEWSRIQWNYMDNQRNEGIRCLLGRLEKSEYNLVKTIFRILNRIASLPSNSNECESEDDRVHVASLQLAARLGPYLLWERGQAPRHSTKEKVGLQTVWLISYMIDNYTVLF